MNESALQLCLRRALEQAITTSALDEQLATHHGLSWGDFVLLEQLSQRPDGLPETELAQCLGLSRSRLLVRTRPLEKSGWLHRTDHPRRLTLRPAARGLLSQATQTAAVVCEQLRLERQLRDIGVDGSEIGSIDPELLGTAALTRRRIRAGASGA